MEKARNEALLATIEEQTTNAAHVQEALLENILERNAETDYLRQYLHGQTDKKLFKKNVPIVSYEDIKPYIDRIVNGEPSNILMAEPLTELILSSGTTTGQPKMIPSTVESLQNKVSVPKLVHAVMRKYFDGLSNIKAMSLLFMREPHENPSGIKVRVYTASLFLSNNFQDFLVRNSTTVEMVRCLDTKQSMYCQLLSGLLHRDQVSLIGTVFASSLARCVKFLQDYWKEMCFNLRTGRLSEWIDDPACKSSISSILSRPNPELADTLENIFGNKSWEGIVKKLWPKTKYIDAVVTGAMSQYITLLDFYCGGLPLVSTTYASSEACFGINLNPLDKPSDVSYTFLPHMAYFEFLPVDGQNTRKLQDEAVDLVDVKVGQYYEVVVTTSAGLYRYRVGDVLKVTGFYNNSPQFQFVERQNAVLSIDVEKTSESDLSMAIAEAKLLLQPLGLLLSAYTSYSDTSCTPGRYVLFWEIKQTETDNDDNLRKLDPKTMEQCCARVEELLDFTYKDRRKVNVIAPLEIRVVELGAFDALMDIFVSQGASITQYKPPCSIKHGEVIETMNSRVIGTFFSSKSFS